MGKGRPSACPSCGSTESLSKGFRYNAHGQTKDRKCLKCGRRYTVGSKVKLRGVKKPVRELAKEPAQEQAVVSGAAELDIVGSAPGQPTVDPSEDQASGNDVVKHEW